MSPDNACRLHHLYLPRCTTPCPRRRGGPTPTTKARQIEVGGMMDDQDEDLARLTDLDVTWGFDRHAFLQERSQETPVAGDDWWLYRTTHWPTESRGYVGQWVVLYNQQNICLRVRQLILTDFVTGIFGALPSSRTHEQIIMTIDVSSAHARKDVFSVIPWASG